jgi:hypothetical protein
VVLAVFLVPTVARAQSTSGWGLIGSIVPAQSWNVISPLDEYLFAHGGTADISGSDFTIGIARGRTLGGDWSVSYVRRTLEDGSRFQADTETCFNDICSPEIAEFYLTRGATFSGVEVHKYFNFVTIARRVQVGLNLASGIGAFDGDLERHNFDNDFRFVGGQLITVRTETVTTEPARDFASISPFPLGKVEAAVGVIAAPGLKIRASGGLNFPGSSVFRLTGIYLFGAH